MNERYLKANQKMTEGTKERKDEGKYTSRETFVEYTHLIDERRQAREEKTVTLI